MRHPIVFPPPWHSTTSPVGRKEWGNDVYPKGVVVSPRVLRPALVVGYPLTP